MWLMTRVGFFSVVQQPGHADTFMVRARRPSHLEALKAEQKQQAKRLLARYGR